MSGVRGSPLHEVGFSTSRVQHTLNEHLLSRPRTSHPAKPARPLTPQLPEGFYPPLGTASPWWHADLHPDNSTSLPGYIAASNIAAINQSQLNGLLFYAASYLQYSATCPPCSNSRWKTPP